ncbi:cell wall-binding repeat-containing protein [Dactylosporangium aurantiacum]|uniref:Cell wall-binding repeat-containing protein n=1 Tax=Dactylosporangium aurantiacum TaxID=35754 RepID=A0A9Q9IDB6_9ACTN|nr:cell wall-binding repeat-containing protein [Dactylosporangium aurantiacum]MDG6101928.1 cell wall-binding repeat-containing protein [Dactylosporangium aurantiacum]UWZ52280.1 cell wall-binding repeat-containing protein [Dactylosporangium aurantiacum]
MITAPVVTATTGDSMSFGLTRRSAILAAMTGATAVAVPGLVPGQRTAHASLPGSGGSITFRRDFQIFIANADGTGERTLVDYAPQSRGSGEWSPDGSRFVFSSGSAIESVRQDGSDREVLAGPSTGTLQEPTYTPDGAFVIFSDWFRLRIAPAGGGGGEEGEILFGGPADTHRSEPAVSVTGTVVFQEGQGEQSVIRRLESNGAATTIITGGVWEPDFSPDGTKLAYSRSTGGMDGVPRVVQIWMANADGSGMVQLTTEATAGVANTNPTWTTDGTAILFTCRVNDVPHVKRIDVTTKTITTIVVNGYQATCQPVNDNTVERVWGATALGTAVATSRYNWADHGVDDGFRAPAKAVVLSRDDVYFDALGGSALAVGEQGPLLITPPGKLHADTQAEMQRILGGSGTVYLLGGTVALSAKVESQVRDLGYTVVRLWGQDEYATAVAVAKAITTQPSAVILATSLKYYDALAAGAAAGANPGTVVVLTAGDTMPAATAAYLDGLDPEAVAMIAVGGPAVRALENAGARNQLPSWPDGAEYYPVFGATEFETAVAVAEFFFTGPRTAAVATATTWFDALTGGAMIGANGGPLLLSAPGTLSEPTRAYFSRNAGSITYGVLLGGPLALKDSLIGPLGNAISVPGAVGYEQYTETFTVPKTLRRSTTQHRRAATGTPGPIPGTEGRAASL